MNLQIKHQNPNTNFTKATFAIEVPTKEQLLDLVELGVKELNLQFGMTRVHPNDQYNKRLGKIYAINRMKPQLLQLNKIEIRDNNRVVYHFHTYVDKPKSNEIYLDYSTIEVGFSFVPQSSNSRLEYIFTE